MFIKIFIIAGLTFTDGDAWQEQSRFALRHLKDLGFGRTSSENLIQEEIHDLIEDIKIQAKTSGQVADFRGLFNLSLMNVLYSFIGGDRFKHDDEKFKKLIAAVNLYFSSASHSRAGIPIPKFLLKHFPLLKKFIGFREELFFPIQNFIRVILFSISND